MKKEKELTWAEIKAMYAEIAMLQKETDQLQKENALQMKETDRLQKEAAIRSKETDKKFDRLEKMIANSNQRIEGISRSNGEFCEEYFINCFKENPTFMGEKYDCVVEYLRPHPKLMVIDDEYDLVLHNGSAVVLIEMKYKANMTDVGKMFSKLHSYRANYPMFENYKIYLCLASFRFPKNIREKAEEEGIVLIEQKGDKNEVVTKNVRTW
jgi:hypothetical protein